MNKLREQLAKLEHDQWVKWASSIMENENLSDERKERWATMLVPYEELSEKVKDYDRVWADKVLALFKKYGEEIIGEDTGYNYDELDLDGAKREITENELRADQRE